MQTFRIKQGDKDFLVNAKNVNEVVYSHCRALLFFQVFKIVKSKEVLVAEGRK